MLLLDHGGVARERPADLEVLALDDALRARDLAPDDRALDGRIGLRPEEARRDQRCDAVAHEQVVLEADEESRLARIALAARPAAQLQIDAPALVPVGADDVEAAERGDPVAFGSRRSPPRRMSVPRPAMLVEIVTAPSAPARATIGASSASFLAFSTSHATPARRSRAASRSDSVDASSVPTSTGRPGRMRAPDLVDDRALLGLAMGEHDVGLDRSATIGRWVGMTTTSSP